MYVCLLEHWISIIFSRHSSSAFVKRIRREQRIWRSGGLQQPLVTALGQGQSATLFWTFVTSEYSV